MKTRTILYMLYGLVLAGAIIAGARVPSTSVSAFADPKATPTPNPCCEFIFSRYCLLCPPKAAEVRPTSRWITGLNAKWADPKECPAKCFRDTRGICWCPN